MNINKLTFDRDLALQQLAALGYKDGNIVHLRTIAGKGCKGYPKNLEATYPNLPWNELEQHQIENKGIYFVVNSGGHKDADVNHGLAIFCEWDNKDLEWQKEAWKEFKLPEPSLQIQTRKSIHNYWIFDEPNTVDNWQKLQSDLLVLTESDRALKNPSRVMRLAGFCHIKAEAEPLICQIISNSGKRYSYNDLRQIIPHVEEQKTRTKKQRKHIAKKPVVARYADEEVIQTVISYLNALAPGRADDYYSWIEVGMILKNIDESLLDTWDEWSEQSDKYESGICEEKWKSFDSEGDLRLGTLIKWAKEDGWCPSNSLYQGNTAKEIREKRYPLTHRNKKVINQQYLGLDESVLPDSGILGLRSAKGTGKTELIGGLAAKYEKVLYVTSRNSLNESAASRLGLVFHHDTSCLENANKIAITFHSLWKVNPSYLKGCLLILDEAKQGLTELTSSTTLKNKRLETKATLEALAKVAKLIILSDADLTNAELDYVAISVPDKPVTVINNEWMPTDSNYYWVDAPDKSFINQLILIALKEQKKLHIVSDSKDYVLTMEELIISKFPDLKIKAIHGDNSDTPENKDFLKNINSEIKNYDVLINSPSIDSGVSIDVHHFDAVFGVFIAGVIPAWTLSQGLNRVRDNVPRYVWVTDNTGEKRETDPKKVIDWALQNHQDNTSLLGNIERDSDTDDYKITAYSPFGYLWAESTIKRNHSLNNLKYDLLNHLQSEGVLPIKQDKLEKFTIKPNSDDDSLARALQQDFKKCNDEIKLSEATAIAEAELIKEFQADEIKNKRTRTSDEKRKLNKYYLHQFYQQEITPELVMVDNKHNLRDKLRHLIHILLPEEYVINKDIRDRENNSFFGDSKNYLLKRKMWEEMKIVQWLDLNRSWHKESPELLEWHESIKDKAERIKRILGITITEDPVKTLGLCLKALGLETTGQQNRCHTSSDKQVTANNNQGYVTGKRVRIYKLEPDRWKLASEVVESHTERWNEPYQKLEEEKKELLELIEQDKSGYFTREQVVSEHGAEFAIQLDTALVAKGKDWDWFCMLPF